MHDTTTFLKTEKELFFTGDAKQEIQDQVITFRLRPKGSTLYTQVEIWPTVKDLKLAYPVVTDAEEGEHVPAFVIELDVVSFAKDEKEKKEPLFALTCFTQEELTHEIISHEMCHVALRWSKRLRLDVQKAVGEGELECHPNEEKFCYAQGSLVGNLYDKLRKYNIYVS